MSVFDLWLPIVVGAAAVHIASTLAWTALPHHVPEWRPLPGEGELIAVLKKIAAPAGQYVFPHPKDPHPDQQAPDPNAPCQGNLIVYDKPVSMGAAIGKTLAFFFVATFVIGYLASLGLSPASTKLDVFRFVFVAGLLTHVAARFPGAFWFKRKTLLDSIDGTVYALLTAGAFVWLWPYAAA
ncbi:hypothetical protein Pla175_02590 [Pirellulimonas nuda]|uniref:Uncharacterized protein n=1 Tax=Pirellulimonas nuda TaxID=2528009 RepID=A0A518D612_9BACT|nr:hypothetical protein [Pirellulimonas nuda]QDU86905.1 hypothetical protein Pla175_02590 [Pirellulimonas nuda]